MAYTLFAQDIYMSFYIIGMVDLVDLLMIRAVALDTTI